MILGMFLSPLSVVVGTKSICCCLASSLTEIVLPTDPSWHTSGPVWTNVSGGTVASHWSRGFWVSLCLIVLWVALLTHACSPCALASLQWY